MARISPPLPALPVAAGATIAPEGVLSKASFEAALDAIRYEQGYYVFTIWWEQS
jgi:hypothetical protein